MAMPSQLSFLNLPRSLLFPHLCGLRPLAAPSSSPCALHHHITLNTHKGANCHAHKHGNVALALSSPSDKVSQAPSLCPLLLAALCLKKNKPVEKNTVAFGVVGSLSFSFLLSFL